MVRIIYMDHKKVIFFGSKGRETVILRKARKRHLCNEKARNGILIHRHFIEAGEHYFDDHLRLLKRRKYGLGYFYHHNMKICSKCWGGPRPRTNVFEDSVDDGKLP